MRWSQCFIPTLRESPAEVESPGLRWMVRAGYLRRAASGVNHYLPAGQRVMGKLEALVRAEMARAGGQEVRMAGSGNGAALAIARGEIRSYKQLPQGWYEFAERDVMAYGFGDVVDLASLWRRVFLRCGVDCLVAESDRETAFLVFSDYGEERVVVSDGKITPIEWAKALPAPPSVLDDEAPSEPELVHTPGQKTIAEVSAFLKVPETSQMKSLVWVADAEPVLALLRGDHQLSHAKLRAVCRAEEVRPATPAEIRAKFGADPGSLGPIGVDIRVLGDEALRGRRNMVAGANRDDYHLLHVTPGEDFAAEFADIRQVSAGDTEAATGGPIEIRTAMALGSATRTPAGLRVLGRDGTEMDVGTSLCRVDLERTLQAAIEQHADKDGIVLPRGIAPFDVVVTPVNMGDAAQSAAAEALYHELRGAGLDVLLDDRDERPGVKFKDADLIGIPVRVTVGKKLAEGLVEVSERREKTHKNTLIGGVSTLVSPLFHPDFPGSFS